MREPVTTMVSPEVSAVLSCGWRRLLLRVTRCGVGERGRDGDMRRPGPGEMLKSFHNPLLLSFSDRC
jgi:hypothetical protein